MSSGALVPVVLLTEDSPSAALIEHLALSVDESFTVLPSADGATASVCDAYGRRMLEVSVPKAIAYSADIPRVLRLHDPGVWAGARYWTEVCAWVVDPAVGMDVAPNLGIALAAALGEECGGVAILTATGDIV
ncbi:hypothetical protein [Demequina sp. NBRC 110055]|uniref:hypothetical protein n=1 Tax=Demequina sp. NBRC 110055 TaxID=1570344 RepID=UPI0009FB9721|nr:hypothetical protein [Demequina sp. NBRC 110055]